MSQCADIDHEWYKGLPSSIIDILSRIKNGIKDGWRTPRGRIWRLERENPEGQGPRSRNLLLPMNQHSKRDTDVLSRQSKALLDLVFSTYRVIIIEFIVKVIFHDETLIWGLVSNTIEHPRSDTNVILRQSEAEIEIFPS